MMPTLRISLAVVPCTGVVLLLAGYLHDGLGPLARPNLQLVAKAVEAMAKHAGPALLVADSRPAGRRLHLHG